MMLAKAHGNKQASSKIENSVVTTGSNNWYRSRPRSEKLNLVKNLERLHRRLLGFSPTSNIDGGGAQHIRQGKSNL
jgi:hypothetical protein